jgi:hypothetical protein
MRLILFLIFFAITALNAAESQVSVENSFIRGLAIRFRQYQQFHPTTSITSLVQVLEVKSAQELIRYEDLFLPFGTNAGFENSILEKFVFVPTGATIPDSMEGGLVLISSKPFPSPEGGWLRAAVAKTEDGFRGKILSEDLVQKMMKKAGLGIPIPVYSPPIERPPLTPFEIQQKKDVEEWKMKQFLKQNSKAKTIPTEDSSPQNNSNSIVALEGGQISPSRNRVFGWLIALCAAIFALLFFRRRKAGKH